MSLPHWYDATVAYNISGFYVENTADSDHETWWSILPNTAVELYKECRINPHTGYGEGCPVAVMEPARVARSSSKNKNQKSPKKKKSGSKDKSPKKEKSASKEKSPKKESPEKVKTVAPEEVPIVAPVEVPNVAPVEVPNVAPVEEPNVAPVEEPITGDAPGNSGNTPGGE